MLGLLLAGEPNPRLMYLHIFSRCLKKLEKEPGGVIILSATITESFISMNRLDFYVRTTQGVKCKCDGPKVSHVVTPSRLQQEL